MSHVPVIINDDPILQEQLEQRLVDPTYKLIPLPATAPSSTTIEQVHPAVIVVNVPGHHSLEQEQPLLELLHNDPFIQKIPVLVCSDRPAVLQSVMRKLQQRPGVVLASRPDVEELLVKLRFTQTCRHQYGSNA